MGGEWRGWAGVRERRRREMGVLKRRKATYRGERGDVRHAARGEVHGLWTAIWDMVYMPIDRRF